MGGSNRSELYSELDDYLAKRRVYEPIPVKKPKRERKSLFSRIFSRKSQEQEFMPQHLPVFEEGEHEPLKEKIPLRHRIGKMFSRRHDSVMEEFEPVVEEPFDDTKDDLKQLAKVFMKTLERLPDKELQQFKSTAEFFQFKSILSKHSLIKSPEPANTQMQSEEIVKQ